MKKLIAVLMLFALALSAGAFEIRSPEEGSYTGDVSLELYHNETLDTISYTIGNETFLGCENCSEHNDTLTLDPGDYTLMAEGALGNETYSDEVNFTVEEPVVTDFSLTIVKPEATSYDDTEIDIELEANETLDSLSMSIDNGTFEFLCENCSEFDTERNFSEGNHSIVVKGVLGDTEKTEEVDFTVETEAIVFTIQIIKPEATTYNETEIDVELEANVTLDSISISVDNGSFELLCENCSEYEAERNFTEGNHTLTVKGMLGDTEKTEEVVFTVDLEEEPSLNLVIQSPTNKLYGNDVVHFLFITNMNATMTYELNNDSFDACEDCDEFSDFLTLADGEYDLTVYAESGNLSDTESVSFTVEEQDNETYNGFSQGFQQLPKAVEAGEISDEELADIIRNNKLNPGVINRLIKTGMLSDGSLDAILETQFNPPGIFRKLLGWFGFKQNTYAENIYETYELPQNLEQKVFARDDLPRKYKNEIRNTYQAEFEENTQQGEPETPGKSLNAGSQQKIPPGQAKKMGVQDGDGGPEVTGHTPQGQGQGNSGNGNSGKIPPGQAKKGR